MNMFQCQPHFTAINLDANGCFFVVYFYLTSSCASPGLGKTVAELGLAEFPDVKPVEKTRFSMCTSEVRNFILAKPTPKSVLLCGIEAHVCVLYTALELLNLGLDVHIIADAVSSRTQVNRKFAFDRLRQSGAFITTSESAILGLCEGADHPKFRDVQKLIMENAPDAGLLDI